MRDHRLTAGPSEITPHSAITDVALRSPVLVHSSHNEDTMFVALSTFAVANGMRDAVQQAFVLRPHLVDGVPGFVRMDVFSPLENPEEFWLLTYWRDAESHHSWHRSHAIISRISVFPRD